MPEDKPKDQPKEESAEKKEEVKITDVHSAFNAADKLFEEMNVASEEEAKKKPKKEVKAEEKPCRHCPEGKTQEQLTAEDIVWDSIDYTKPDFPLPIKRGDKIEWINTSKEYHERASKELDYTKKTQDVADDRKGMEKEFDEKQRQLTDVATKFSSIYDALERDGKIKPTKEIVTTEPKEVEPSAVFERWGIDEELADDSEKRMVTAFVEQENKYNKMAEMVKKQGDAVKFMTLREMGNEVKKAADTAREEFPIKSIIDKDSGEDLTKKQFISTLVTKVDSEEGKKRPFAEMVTETIKEIHHIQQQQKEEFAAEQVTDETSVEDFKTKNPVLYEKMVKAIKPSAVAEHEEEIANVPPSLTHIDKDVETSKIVKKGGITSIADGIAKGLSEVEL